MSLATRGMGPGGALATAGVGGRRIYVISIGGVIRAVSTVEASALGGRGTSDFRHIGQVKAKRHHAKRSNRFLVIDVPAHWELQMGGHIGTNSYFMSTRVLDGCDIDGWTGTSLRGYPDCDPVGDGCSIGKNFSCIRGLVLGAEVVIEDNVTITREYCVLPDGTVVTEGTVLT